MYDIHFDKPLWVHFIGIGGISMSGLAEILLDRHFTVTGSDAKTSPLTEHLESLGVKVFVPQSSQNIQDGVELCVYTAAISEDNEEFQEVKRRGIPMMSRADLLGRIMQNYATAINDGRYPRKTTTTSMIGEILMEAAKDPTITVGGDDEGYWWKSSCGTVRHFPGGGLRVHQLLPLLLPQHCGNFKCGSGPPGFL